MSFEHGAERARKVNALVEGLLRAAGTAPHEALYSGPEGEWTAMQVLAHAAELVPFWAGQARKVAEQDRDGEPFGRSTADVERDPDRLAAIERYGRAPLSSVEPSVRDGLALAREDLQAIPDDRWERTGRHATGQERSVASIVDQLLIGHLESHVRQLNALLSRA